MPKLLQVSTSANWGAIGRIAEQINVLAQDHAWETYFAYGRTIASSTSHTIKVGSMLDEYEHYAEYRLFDNDGLASRSATKFFIKEIERIKPDIIHLHNIHDHWLNYRLLFEYLRTIDMPVVWTLHDCWSFTGGCMHFTVLGCNRWREGCCGKGCPAKSGSVMRRLFDKTEKHYRLKKELLAGITNLTLVTVSYWLESVVRDSFLKNNRIVTIHNGLDINVFKPVNSKAIRSKFGINDSRYVLGVSHVWTSAKGWEDFLHLKKRLPKGVELVLVGLDKEKLRVTNEVGIIGIPRTDNVEELAAIYSGADVFLNLSREETLGMTTIEAMACGTPAIVYNETAVAEPVSIETGLVVETGDIDGLVEAIDRILKSGKDSYSEACRAHVEKCFNKDDRYLDYLRLFQGLVKNE